MDHTFEVIRLVLSHIILKYLNERSFPLQHSSYITFLTSLDSRTMRAAMSRNRRHFIVDCRSPPVTVFRAYNDSNIRMPQA